MSAAIHEVYIASSCDELAALRQRLAERLESHRGVALRAVLPDGEHPRGSVPWLRNLEAARRASVVVLLVGRRPAARPADGEPSDAQLEHAAALAAEPPPVVLPFLTELGHDDERALDPTFAEWRLDLLQRHTVAFVPADPPGWVIDEIHETVCGAIHQLLDDAERERLADVVPDDGLGRLEGPDAGTDELTLDERRSRSGPAVEIEGGEKRDELIRHPARMAAREQRDEARKALALGERQAAIAHFRQALEHRQLDAESAYRLARLLAITGRRQDAQEAVSLALRAAKVAGEDERPLRAAAAHVVAANAAARLGEHERALTLARRATGLAPWYGDAHRELAVAHARNQQVDAALDAAAGAFFRHPPTFRQLRHHPAFQRHAEALAGLEERLCGKVKKVVAGILAVEAELTDAAPAEPSSEWLFDLLSEGRKATQVALGRLRREAARLRQRSERLTGQRNQLLDLHRQWRDWQQREETRLRLGRPKLAVAGAIGSSLVALLVVGAALLFTLSLDLPEHTSRYAFGSAVALVWLVAVLRWRWRRRKWKADGEQSRARYSQATTALRESGQRLEGHLGELRESGRRFERRVHDFEETALRWAILSPGRTPLGAGVGDLVRLGSEPPGGLDVEIDDDPLHPRLREVLEHEPSPPPRHSLHRVVEIEGVRVAARWAAYAKL